MLFTPENSVSHAFLSATSEPFGEDIIRQASEIPRYPSLNLDVRESIDKFQHQLEALVASSHPDDQYARIEISRQFHGHDALYAPFETYSTVAGAGDLLPWLAGTSYSKMLDFLIWNKERLEQHQQRIEQDIPNLQEVALQNIDHVIGHGIMPPVAKSLARLAFSWANFVAIDAFESGFRRAAGMLYTNENPTRPYTIALANGYEGGPDGLERWQPHYPYVMAHETWHAVGDVVFAGFRAILNENQACDWWNESEAEHLTRVGFHGEPHITSPRLRTHQQKGMYLRHRELSHLIKRNIPQSLVCEAFIEPFAGQSDNKDHLVARKELDRLLRHNFRDVIDLGDADMNIVELINSEISMLPRAQHAAALDGWKQKLETVLGITS